jgi:hypothetical protein
VRRGKDEAVRSHQGESLRTEARRVGLTRTRLVEIAVAVLLTLAALLFVALAVWAV